MKYLLFLLLLSASFLASAQTIKAVDAANYVGKTVTICDTVTNVFTSTKSDKAPTLLDLGGSIPTTFTAVIFKDEAAKFSYDPLTLKGKVVCITGEVKDYKGKPEIVVDDEKQIKVGEGSNTKE